MAQPGGAWGPGPLAGKRKKENERKKKKKNKRKKEKARESEWGGATSSAKIDVSAI